MTANRRTFSESFFNAREFLDECTKTAAVFCAG